MDYNKLVNDARRDTFDVVCYPFDVVTAGVVALGDFSFANVGKNETESGKLGVDVDRQCKQKFSHPLGMTGYSDEVAIA